MPDVLSLGKGVRLGLVVEGEGWAPGTCVCGDLVYDYCTHPLQYRSFELDMQETSATEVCESLFSSFFKKRMCLGLVVEGEGRAPGTCVVEICLRLHIPFSTRVSS